VIKNKKVILPFLLLAWTIIFAHSIIPHHHHSEISSIEINQCHHEHHDGHDHTTDFSLTEFDFCDHNESGHACHFHVEILTQLSIDNVFIGTNENTLYSNISCVKTNHYSFYQGIISEEFPKTNYLRGPPSLA